MYKIKYIGGMTEGRVFGVNVIKNKWVKVSKEIYDKLKNNKEYNVKKK